MAQTETDLIEVRLNAIRYGARDTNLYEFVRPDGQPLPAYEPGAHIDVHLPNGIVRQYSLILPAREPLNYTLGIKRDPASRGGSRYVHDELRVGTDAQDQRAAQQLSAARGCQPRHPVRRRHRHHADLVHGAAARGTGPLLEALLCLPLARRHGVPRRRSKTMPPRNSTSTTRARASFSTSQRIVARRPEGRASVLLRADADAQRVRGRHRGLAARAGACRIFHAQGTAADKKGGFVVELARSGQEFVIPEGQTILQVLLDAGIDIDYSCELGICGACEQRVISGEPEHRDAILTEEEQASNTKVMICCAGCKSERLVLDL